MAGKKTDLDFIQSALEPLFKRINARLGRFKVLPDIERLLDLIWDEAWRWLEKREAQTRTKLVDAITAAEQGRKKHAQHVARLKAVQKKARRKLKQSAREAQAALDAEIDKLRAALTREGDLAENAATAQRHTVEQLEKDRDELRAARDELTTAKEQLQTDAQAKANEIALLRGKLEAVRLGANPDIITPEQPRLLDERDIPAQMLWKRLLRISPEGGFERNLREIKAQKGAMALHRIMQKLAAFVENPPSQAPEAFAWATKRRQMTGRYAMARQVSINGLAELVFRIEGDLITWIELRVRD